MRRYGFDMAAVVSASHNPYEDNGIKFFGPEGMKLDDEQEGQIEARLEPSRQPAHRAACGSSTAPRATTCASSSCASRDSTSPAARVLLDCANGATYRVAPEIFRRLGADVDAVAAEPDGRNINLSCGSTHVEALAGRMAGHDLGFAFDGDGDRVLAVDRDGSVVDGDELIALAALHLRGDGRLPGDGVAVTVMTNYGFHQAMERGRHRGGDHAGGRPPRAGRAAVRRGWSLGGEQSGHLIETGFVPAGDGIAAALLTLEALAGADLAARHAMQKLPQLLINVKVRDREAIEAAGPLWDAVAEESERLDGIGRVLVRASGTEPLRESNGGSSRTSSRAGDRPETGRSGQGGTRLGRLMCGIIGYVGPRECRDLLLEGLQRLEYRGYDSAGLSLVINGSVGSVHSVGNLERLRAAVAESNGHLTGSTGIGHTRWATHGRVTEANAHPHWDTSGRVHIVLNGIVENWTELRDRLRAEGAEFTSETDAEVVAHLVADHFDGDLVEAVRLAYNDLRGHYAFVAMSADDPKVLVGARKECPLVVGLGEGESFIASAIPAFLSETRSVQLVHDGEIVAITPEGSRFLSPEGEELQRDVDQVDWDEEQAEKGGYETFMLKEIHEQADAVAETVADRLATGWSTSATSGSRTSS